MPDGPSPPPADLPPHLQAGVILPDPSQRPRPSTLLERLARLLSKGRIATMIAGSAIIGLVSVLTGTLDLWDSLFGGDDRPAGSVEVTYRTSRPGPATPEVPRWPSPGAGESGSTGVGNRASWDGSQTECRDSLFGEPPVLTREPSPHDEFSPSDGAVGLDQRSRATLFTQPFVREDVIDVPPASLSVAKLRELGTYHSGPLDVLVLLANRTEDELVITDISPEIERRPVPTGTIIVQLGGDPVALNVLEFDLGQPSPVARGVKDDCSAGEPFFEQYVFEVAPGASEVVLVRLQPGPCLCLVRLDIEYGHAGELKNIIVPSRDEDPFAVVDAGTDYHYQLIYVTAGPTNPIQKYDCRAPRSDGPGDDDSYYYDNYC